ncbi:MAG: phosphopyruvate hydratase [Patescibacteria group bacterium]
MPRISNIHAHKVLNSRGNWTINTEVELEDGAKGHGEIPEGASKGGREAVSVNPELAVEIINERLGPNFCGEEAENQYKIDQRLIEIDGTPDKSKLGENTLLSVSIAVAKAVAHSRKIQLFQYLSELFQTKEIGIPTPIFNVINGGKHAQNDLSFQEFMAIPSRFLPYDKALDMGAKTYLTLKNLLAEDGFDIEVGDEGGFAPENLHTRQALDFIVKAAKTAHFKVEEEIFLGLDVASNSFFEKGSYVVKGEKVKFDAFALKKFYGELLHDYPIIYIEDMFMEEDLTSWADFYKGYSEKLLIVGDDLTVTNTKRLETVAAKKCCNAVIVKPNQIGTLTETYEFVKKAKDLGMYTIVSHRSGEAVVDTFIADFAVAVNADYLKAGAPAHERVAKYNKLLEIYGELNGIEGYCKI